MNRTLRIRTQLALLCAVFIVMLASLGGLGLWRAKLNSDAMQSMYVDRVVPLQQLKTISDMYAVNMVDTAHKFADGALTSAQATEALQQARQSIDKEWSAYLATYLVPEEVKLADRLKPLMAAADATVPRLMELIRADDRAGVAAFRAQTMYPVFDPMQGVIGELIALQLDVSRQMYQDSQAGVQTLVGIMVAATLASALVGGAISVWIIWRLTHQLGAEPHEVRALADAIASGDLTQRIMVPSGDGSSVMAAMKRMNEHLVSVVAGVRQNADSVSNASREIAQGNHDLSQRSEEQASALEQTAASMEQMTANVGSNTEHALQANRLAQSAAEGVQKGGESVGQVLESMRSIDAASNRIMEIVSMIDGIAFQTNILALNAAVEAARAGEQGRGFAVVAGEVRLLAQRSATAAKEVHELIHQSHSEVEKGSALASSAAQTVNQSVDAIAHLAQLMSEISSASREQSDGLEQVNAAVGQMDQATQQNAALVEQTAAAASSLRDQADRLVSSVAGFRLPIAGQA